MSAYTYDAKVIRVIDADTYDVEIDLGFRLTTRLPLRVAHIDAYEHNTDLGQQAIFCVKGLLGALPKDVVVKTYKPYDKYGRYLATVYVDGMDLGAHLVTLGFAVPYEGGKKQ